MNPAALVQELARQVRTDTRRILTAAEPDWLTWAPPGTSNHLLWHGGHALWLMDVLGIQLLTGQSELPPGWEDLFGMKCRPVAQTTTWPQRSELDHLLAKQLDRFLDLLEQVPLRQLLSATSHPPTNLACRLLHGLHDEAKHQGEMYLLLKMCRTSQG